MEIDKKDTSDDLIDSIYSKLTEYLVTNKCTPTGIKLGKEEFLHFKTTRYAINSFNPSTKNFEFLDLPIIEDPKDHKIEIK